MFLEKTTHKVKGYIEVTVFGFFIERFLNLILNSEINVWNIKKVDDATAIIYTDIKGYKEMIPFANKTGCKVTVSKKYGLPFYALKHKKRKVFALFFLIIAFGIYFYNLHIWNIDIVGDFTFPIEDIKKELDNENIKIGTLKSSIDSNYVKNNIYMRRHDIAWIGINFKGTTCTVEIIEANLKKRDDELDKVPCNIVAEKPGMIYSINVLEGDGMYVTGDLVKSGDILISGLVKSSLGPDRRVNAKGEIYIKTWYTNKEIVQLERNIIFHTGNVQNKFAIKIQNYRINLGNNSTKFEKYDTIKEENELNLLGITKLPISLEKTSYKEIGVDSIKYTEKQAIKSVSDKMKNSILKQISNSSEIVKEDIKTSRNGNKITIVVTIECIEKIGIRKKLEG